MISPRHRETRRLIWYLPLVAPFVGTLWVPFFNSIEPQLGGVPYFYWYQLAWIAMSAVVTAGVYFATREFDADASRGEADGTAGPGPS